MVILSSHNRWVHLRERLVSHKQRALFRGFCVDTESIFSENFLSTRRKYPKIALECQSLWIVEAGTPPAVRFPPSFRRGGPESSDIGPQRPPPPNSQKPVTARWGFLPQHNPQQIIPCCRPLSCLKTVRRSRMFFHSWRCHSKPSYLAREKVFLCVFCR